MSRPPYTPVTISPSDTMDYTPSPGITPSPVNAELPVACSPFEVSSRDDLYASLMALLRRKRQIPQTNMLASHAEYAHYFTVWVSNVWHFVDIHHVSPRVAFTSIRTWVVCLSVWPLTFWSRLKWERYACMWIALKVEDMNNNFGYSVDEYLDVMFGVTLTLRAERESLLHAERAVLHANQFSMSYPDALTFADILIEMCENTTHLREKIVDLLRRVSHQVEAITADPVAVACAAIHVNNPLCLATLTRLTGTSQEAIVQVQHAFMA